MRDMIFFCVWLYDIILHQVFKKCFAIPRLLNATTKKLALKVASSTMMCSARLGRDWHYLRLNEVIICQEHVVLCIHEYEILL
jgi:hypothetical protein